MREKTVAIVVTIQEDGLLLSVGRAARFLTPDKTVGDLCEILKDPSVRSSRPARPRDWIDSMADAIRGLADDGEDDDDFGDDGGSDRGPDSDDED